MSADNAADNDSVPVHIALNTHAMVFCQGSCQTRANSVRFCGMDRDAVNSICRALPGAEWSDPWGGGHDAWKVGGKMFACIGTANTGVSVKTPDIETAGLLIEMARAERAPYFHKSWVHIPWGLVNTDEMAERLYNSYRIVRSGLTKKFQATLDPFED